MFRAIQVDRDESAEKSAPPEVSVTELEESALPEGDVLVDVEWSTLNYKDGLVLNGLGGLVKHYPHVPGIDFAGSVVESDDAAYAPGDRVVLTGWRVGELHWGGYAERARVKGEWLVPLPDGLTTREAMSIGTAGFTAMLGLMTLEEAGVVPDSGPVLVTGAAGGVGSVSCALLARAGYTVEGSTGREETHDYLRSLGVDVVVSREEAAAVNGRPLNGERWAGCIDSVGGTTLANVLTRLRHGGAVAAIGLAGGSALETSVIPFLLRGVSLRGVDSVMCPRERRVAAWERLARELPREHLESMVREVALEEVVELGREILDGRVRGRIVVDVRR